MKILIIDDNPADRELMMRRLRKDFPYAEFVPLGRQADSIEALARNDYDMVLTDYQLNWGNGLWVLQMVKAHNPHVPVVMFTGTGSEEVAVEGMKAGLSNYVLKKNLDHLPFAVQESLEKARLRKQYEETERRLKASEERYREVFEQGLAGICVSTAQGNILVCNAAFARMFGFSSIEEASRANICDFYPTREACEAFLSLLRREKRLKYHEVELRRQDGEPIFVVGNVVGKFNERGELVEIKEYIFDNTEQKKMEAQFQHIQKMESLGQLVSGIAHDFNNMLGGILGHTERSLGRIDQTHPLYENLTHIRNITERAARMTRQLVAFSRRQVLEPKDIDVNRVISDLLEFIGKIVADHIEIVFTPDPTLKAIHADATQIEQVLLNLCINARDAMPDGGRLLIETCNTTLDNAFCRQHPQLTPGEYVQLVVTDTGTGIDARAQERIFEPFFTTKEPGKGTGLGLAMVHGIVGQHNGMIDVSSKVGKGTTFTLYFPVVDAVPAPLPENPKVAAKMLEEPVSVGAETVLLVEDDSDLRFLMKEMLLESGHTVVAASDGAEGWQKFQEYDGAIHLVVADVVTPRMKGNELYRRIREISPSTQFLFVSGYQANQISRNFVLEEGLNFLPKPFDLDDFTSKVRDILEHRSASVR